MTERSQSVDVPLSALDVMMTLHTGRDAVICFHGQKMKPLGAMKAGCLHSEWNTLSPYAESEMYFSINSTYQCVQTNKYPTGLFSSRKQNSMRYANALFVDMDADPGQDVMDLRSKAEIARASVGLPLPTFTVHSGRGLWYLWVFDQPFWIRFPDQQERWRRAAEKLSDIFSTAGVDRGSSTDITRIMRVPNSRNEKNRAQVQFFQTGLKCEFLMLASKIGLEIRKTAVTPDEIPPIVKNPAKQKAARERWRRMFAGLEKLVQLRGRIIEGQRRWTVFLFALTMRRAGLARGLIQQRCRDLGMRVCCPPLELTTIEDKIASGIKRRLKGFISFKRLQSTLAVTADELRAIPELLPKPKREPQRKAEKIQNAIRLITAECGLLPSASDLLFLLTQKGFKASLASIYRYLKKMGLTELVSKESILKTSARKNTASFAIPAGELRKAHGFEVLRGGAGKRAV